MTDKTRALFKGYAKEISNEIRRSEIGSHLLLQYPDLPTLREMYLQYTKSALNENEIVIILPFYETADHVRRILSEDPACIDVEKYEKEQRFMAMDFPKPYFRSVDGIMPFMKQIMEIIEYARSSGRSNVTLLGDMGSFFYYEKKHDLVEYEMQLPRMFDMNLKGICLYHKIDFRKISEVDKQKLHRHHIKSMQLLPSQDAD